MNLSVKPLHRSSNEKGTAPKISRKEGAFTSLLKGILLITASLIVALLMVEIIVRLFFAPSSAAPWSDRPRFYFRAADSETMQDYGHSPVKPENTYRIAVLGDSFTFATMMQFTDAFPKQLERILNLHNSSEKVEVINYGVPGYSTSNEAELMKSAIQEGADLVLLQITLNDPQLKPYAPKGITGKNEFGSYVPSSLIRALSPYWKTPGFVFERLHNTSTHQRYIDYYFGLFNGEKTWDSFSRAVRLIARRGKRNEIPVLAVVFPLFGTPLNDSYPFFEIHKKINGLLEQEKIPALDIFEEYRDIPLSRIQVIPGQDFHPNEIGHRIAAEAIYEWLENSGNLPAKFHVAHKYRSRLDIRPDKNNPVNISEKQ